MSAEIIIPHNHHHSYMDLCAVFGGTFVALAITIIFMQFGGAIGLAMNPDMEWDPQTAWAKALTIGLWVLWTQVLASLIGGYIAGRMRQPVAGTDPHEREMRDGIHGLVTWGASTTLVFIGGSIIAAAALYVADANSATQIEPTEIERKAAIVLAFSTAAITIVSAIAAWFGGTKGGEHRDEVTDLTKYFSFRKK